VSGPTYFLRIDGVIRGPCDLGEMRALGLSGAIHAETEVAPAREGPWSLLITIPERAAVLPAGIALAANPQFERTADSQTPVHLDDLIATAATPGKLLRTHEDLHADVYRAPRPATPENEVEAMVRDVQAREAQFAPPAPPGPKRKISRRLVLVLTAALLGNGLLVALPLIYDATKDEWAMMVFRGWLVIFNGGLVATYFVLPKG
jgi:hypothetical protein